jgi:hypothetical protein
MPQASTLMSGHQIPPPILRIDLKYARMLHKDKGRWIAQGVSGVQIALDAAFNKRAKAHAEDFFTPIGNGKYWVNLQVVRLVAVEKKNWLVSGIDYQKTLATTPGPLFYHLPGFLQIGTNTWVNPARILTMEDDSLRFDAKTTHLVDVDRRDILRSTLLARGWMPWGPILVNPQKIEEISATEVSIYGLPRMALSKFNRKTRQALSLFSASWDKKSGTKTNHAALFFRLADSVNDVGSAINLAENVLSLFKPKKDAKPKSTQGGRAGLSAAPAVR